MTHPAETCVPATLQLMNEALQGKENLYGLLRQNPCASCPFVGTGKEAFMEEHSDACIARDPSMDPKAAGISESAGAFAAKISI